MATQQLRRLPPPEEVDICAMIDQYITNLKELKARLASDQGRKEYRVDLAAAIAMICELGFAQLREDVETGKDIWTGGVIKILGSYSNSLTRMLDNWPADEEKPKNIIDALRGNSEQTGD